MVRKQGGSSLAKTTTDYNHPAVAGIKDFSELYQLKASISAEISNQQREL